MIFIAIIVLILLAIGMTLSNYLQMKLWQISVAYFIFALLLYFLNNVLIKYYIDKKAREYSSTEEVIPGTQKWELTAGLGIVPRWVSFLGVISKSAFVSTGISLVIWIL